MKIKQSHNGRYHARVWTNAGTQSIALGTTNKAEAEKLAREAHIAELEQAGKVNALTHETFARILAGRKITGNTAFEVWKEWAKVVGLGRNTIERYSVYIRMFLENSGCDRRPLSATDEKMIDAFVNPQGSPISVSTRRNRLAAMSSYFQVAVAKGLIGFNPVAACVVKLEGLTFEQKEPAERMPFTEQELIQLRSLPDLFQRTVVLLGECYGLRLGDVAQLERAAVNTERNTIIVWTDKRDRRLELPLYPSVRAHLESVPVVDDEQRYYFPQQAQEIQDVKLRAKLSVYFARSLKRIGIMGKSAHCLRHTFASRQAHLGRTIDEIRTRLGHADNLTTRGYIHELTA